MNELEKWSQAQPIIIAIRDFLEWCDEQKIELAVMSGHPVVRLNPIMEARERMIARHVGIDLVALENERRALLERSLRIENSHQSTGDRFPHD